MTISASSFESRYLNGEYLAETSTWHVEDSPYKARWIDGVLSRLALGPKTFAEVGCGAGAVLEELQKLRPDGTYSGFDISPQACALARTRQNDRLRIYQEDITRTALAPFDCLMAIDVFEHVPDYLGFIASLKPLADIKLFHVPLDLSVQGLIRSGMPISRESVGHLHYFTKDTALATLADCGLETLGWEYTAGALEAPVHGMRTRLANLPRRVTGAMSTDLSARLFGGYSLLVVTR